MMMMMMMIDDDDDLDTVWPISHHKKYRFIIPIIPLLQEVGFIIIVVPTIIETDRSMSSSSSIDRSINVVAMRYYFFFPFSSGGSPKIGLFFYSLSAR